MEPPMTVKELSEYLRLDRMTIYKMLKEGNIPASRIGHQWRFFRSDIDEWLRSLRTTRRVSVLLVAEGQDLVNMLTQELPRGSYEVVEVSDAQAAASEASSRQFDIAFLELRKPAVEALRILRQTDPELPIVLVADGGEGKLLDLAMESGVITVIRRPTSGDELRKVMRLLPRRRNSSA